MTPEEQRESERVSLLFHVAMVQIGTRAVEDTLALWDDVPPLPAEGGSRATSAWLATTVAYVSRRRLRARDLALAYYRYQRALTTKTTIARPGVENPPYMTLPELKREFEAVLNPVAQTPVDGSEVGAPPNSSPTPSQPARSAPESSQTPSTGNEELSDEEIERLLREQGVLEGDFEDEQIPVEEIEGLEEELDELEEQIAQQVEDALKALGPDNMNRKMDKIRAQSSDQVDAERQVAHQQAGNRQAATAAREVMNGARGPLYSIGSRDNRLIGFVRVSRTGTPCGFCAMLISRGVVYRGSSGTSVNTTYGDLDLYHDNCQCYAVPIFDMQQFESEQLFALNRYYADLWPIVTKGLGGKAAISAWRRFIRQEAKSQNAQVAAA